MSNYILWMETLYGSYILLYTDISGHKMFPDWRTTRKMSTGRAGKAEAGVVGITIASGVTRPAMRTDMNKS